MIEEISRSSNSQNKVSDADFFSTHPFHVEMEKISRQIFFDSSARKLIANVKESSALKTAIKIPQRIPQPFQCEYLLRLLERLEENGLTYKKNEPSD